MYFVDTLNGMPTKIKDTSQGNFGLKNNVIKTTTQRNSLPSTASNPQNDCTPGKQEVLTRILRTYFQSIQILNQNEGDSMKLDSDVVQPVNGFVREVCEHNVPKVHDRLDVILRDYRNILQSCSTWYRYNLRYFLEYYTKLCEFDLGAASHYIHCLNHEWLRRDGVHEECKDPVLAEYIYAHIINFKIYTGSNATAQSQATKLVVCSTKSYRECNKKLHMKMCDPSAADLGYDFSTKLNGNLFAPHWNLVQNCEEAVPLIYQDLDQEVRNFDADIFKPDPLQHICDPYNVVMLALKSTSRIFPSNVPTIVPAKQRRSHIGDIACKSVDAVLKSWEPMQVCHGMEDPLKDWIDTAFQLLQNGCTMFNAANYQVNCKVLEQWNDYEWTTSNSTCMETRQQLWNQLYYLRVQLYDADVFNDSSQNLWLLQYLLDVHRQCVRDEFNIINANLRNFPECDDVRTVLISSIGLLDKLESLLVDVVQIVAGVLKNHRHLVYSEKQIIPYTLEHVFEATWHMAHYV